MVVEMDTLEAAGLLRADRMRIGGAERPVTIETSRWHAAARSVIHVKGVDSIEQAETLRGAVLLVPRGQLPPAPPGRHYARDLEGLRVVTLEGVLVGRVKEIRETGGADLLVVEDGARERLVPFVKEICRRVDPAGGVIEIDPPEGLLELNDL
jgi:16S rRNA processing protein RimM